MGPTSRSSDAGPVANGDPRQGPDCADDAAVAALRASGAHRLDPARFRYIEVLSRKAAGQSGGLRQRLDGQLANAIAACQAHFEQARSESAKLLPGLMERHPQAADGLRRLHGEGDFKALRRLTARLESSMAQGTGPLGALVRHIDDQAMAQRPPDTGAGARNATAPAPAQQAAPLEELKTVRQFRDSWTALRIDRQMARSQQLAPENPGPLNSHLLVLRTLRRMQEISPAYLEHFMAHAEALMWLDQAGPRVVAVPGKPVRDKRQPRNTKPTSPGRSRTV